ncbi:hypothetical protein P154DRAFT_312955 [Amniculicola lignicola CBS 123094]|uniref:Uncharacterized protein n=1 Tax=Amniculicola lignicola CBS 123094 TaxID=1392246 RepID=A0A6A5WXS7_9PLEO|nr:hypothetical protein P154DRAFT_312955 [Amniculicola lignicola CBS 123094]
MYPTPHHVTLTTTASSPSILHPPFSPFTAGLNKPPSSPSFLFSLSSPPLYHCTTLTRKLLNTDYKTRHVWKSSLKTRIFCPYGRFPLSLFLHFPHSHIPTFPQTLSQQ